MNVDRLMNKWYEEIMVAKSNQIPHLKKHNEQVAPNHKIDCFRAYVRENGFMIIEVNAYNKMSSASKQFINKNYVYGGLV